MARIPLGALTTLNLSTHLDPMFVELYAAAGGDYTTTTTFTIGNGAGTKFLKINGGNASSSGPGIIWQRAGTDVLAIGPASSFLGGSEGSDTIFFTHTGHQRFYTSGAERVRIDSLGNVIVTGTASPLSAQSRGLLTVNGAVDAIVGFSVNGATSGYIGGSATNFEVAGSATLRLVTNGGVRASISSTGIFTPGADNAYPFGSPSFRWTTLYAVTGAINTSDAREKTNVYALTSNELAAAQALANEIGSFKFLSAIKEKGDSARTHIGMTVQRAIEIMENHGLNPMEYAFICHDEWDETAAPKQGDDPTPAGDRYGFRMDQLLAFIAAGMEARLSLIENRLAALESFDA